MFILAALLLLNTLLLNTVLGDQSIPWRAVSSGLVVGLLAYGLLWRTASGEQLRVSLYSVPPRQGTAIFLGAIVVWGLLSYLLVTHRQVISEIQLDTFVCSTVLASSGALILQRTVW